MSRYLGLIGLFVRVSIQESTAYRADFLGHVIMSFVQLGGEFVALWTIFSNTESLAGWNVYQLLTLLGVFRTMTGVIGMVIAPNMRMLMENVREGTLDFVLLKPINSQFFTSMRRVVVWRITDILLGFSVALFGMYKSSGEIRAQNILLFLALLFAGTVTIYSFWLCLGTLSFWFTKVSNIEMVFWNIFEAGRYPVDIYRPMIRVFLTYVVPLAFLIHLPAGALVDKTTVSSVALALAIAAIAFFLSSRFWNYGLRRYSGASA